MVGFGYDGRPLVDTEATDVPPQEGSAPPAHRRREVVNFLKVASAIEPQIIGDGLQFEFEAQEGHRKRVRPTVSDGCHTKNSQPRSVADGIPTRSMGTSS